MCKVYCNDCKDAVTVKTVREFIGEPGHGGWVEWSLCDECDGDDLSEIKPCEECSEPMSADDTEIYCRFCIKEVADSLEEAKREWIEKLLQEGHSQEIIDYTIDNAREKYDE